MSDTFLVNLRCDWCGEMNRAVPYHDNYQIFDCEYCHRPNKIIMEFDTKKILQKVSHD